jgi:hypothetical protein
MHHERTNIVKEILTVEDKFVRYLEILEQKYLKPMMAVAHRRCILREDDIQAVFCDFDKSILPVSRALVAMLRPKVEKWTTQTIISDVFIKLVRTMGVGSVLCRCVDSSAGAGAVLQAVLPLHRQLPTRVPDAAGRAIYGPAAAGRVPGGACRRVGAAAADRCEQKCLSDPECMGLSLDALLIKPVQRLMQYPLLLEVRPLPLLSVCAALTPLLRRGSNC